MRKKMYWGIGTLIILLLGVTAVLLLRDTDTDPEVIYKTDVEPARKTETPIAEKPTARPGFEMVQHGDHWHEVPIDGSETVQDEPVVTITPPVKTQPVVQHVVDASGEVIYPHHELLKTHPVAALRAQAKDSGHWSAKYIRPFPSDDVEANELARYRYLYNYYVSIGDVYNPIAREARKVFNQWRKDHNVWTNMNPTPRENDLMRFTWTSHESDDGALAVGWPSSFSKEDYR